MTIALVDVQSTVAALVYSCCTLSNYKKTRLDNHSLAVLISFILNSCPLFCQCKDTFAPAFLNKPIRRSVSCFGIIGSCNPEDKKIGSLVKPGRPGVKRETMHETRIQEERISGQIRSNLKARLRPLKKPTEIR